MAIVAIVLLAILCYFPIFLHLTSLPIRLWDEGHVVLTSYQMSHNRSWLVVMYDNKPDLWYLKPPFWIWIQAIFIRLFGLSELSVRLPAALAALFTCAIVFVFCWRFLKRIQLGFISVLVLVTSGGYIAEHVTRTGDYDSLLTFLTTVYLFCYFIYVESNDGAQKKFLLFFFIALTLAVLTKGVQGLLFTPALPIYIIARKKLIITLKEKNFYIGFLFFLIFGIGYYFLREALNPGYVQAVWNSEVAGRFNTVIDEHVGPFSYYWDLMINRHYTYWYLFLPCGILIGVAQTDRRLRNFAWFLILCAGVYLIVVSSAKTKLEWYDGPLFPLLAVIVGIFLSWLYDLIRTQEVFKLGLKNSVAAFVPMFLIFIHPYSQTVKDNYYTSEPSWTAWYFEIPSYLKQTIKDHVNIDGYKIIYSQWQQSILFYVKMLGEQGQKVSFTGVEQLQTGDHVIVEEENFINGIKEKFNVQLVSTYDNDVKIFQIISPKQ